jgi:hypothetical protein
VRRSLTAALMLANEPPASRPLVATGAGALDVPTIGASTADDDEVIAGGEEAAAAAVVASWTNAPRTSQPTAIPA